VLDLAGLEFIDSAGLHALLDAQVRAELNGHELVLTRVPAQALRLFSLTGLNTRLSIE
jgi:anti-sigma B factor antagonist/stage II sporulation protein AA (anti-sigma F factor antagonist)